MNTATRTHRVVNLAGATWIAGDKIGAFQAQRPGYGIQEIATGRFVARTGNQPSVWRTRKAAEVNAAHPPVDWPTIEVKLPA